MPSQLLMIIENSLHLPGLGMLAMSRRHQQSLRRFPIHANLEVEIRFSNDEALTVPASVEELQRPADDAETDQQADYVLLIESDSVGELPIGTAVWLSQTWADIYNL
ncbi:hypothetical protein [Solirubrum puertoriconensis]|uniref:Uncharacterized protein n=1 Tax=Solirubrum puertoriconensis TaxID=1751427 RepID=A0A9X0HML6_SOLP1|nr:hypothetical protein [Solirubrum puertoriconensis]KUG08751.1 hypothetical protein ASU33_11495 [Solirubrum puertoriconensis]